MAIIKITATKESGEIRLSLNGRKVVLLAEIGLEQPCPDAFLPMLRDSGVEFELVSSEAEAEEAPGGDSGESSAENPAPVEEPEPETAQAEPEPEETEEQRAERERVEKAKIEAETEAAAQAEAAAHEAAEDLKLLDLSVPKIEAAIAGFSPERLQRLIDAETAGKTRSTLIAALTARLNPPAA